LSAASEASRFKETIYHLSHLSQYKTAQPSVTAKGLDAKLAMLRAWQSQRLGQTHADLLASERFGPACRFFLNDIYAPRDFSQRDHDIEYLYEAMAHFIPEFMLKLVHTTILMNQLTNSLDQALVHVLVDNLSVTDTITSQLYAQAYHICNNYEERAAQIQMVVDIGHMVDMSRRLPLVGTTLRLARLPARSAGWGDLQDFLERGFTAFKHMRGASGFLNTIQQREMDILDRIFDNRPLPF